MKEYFLSVLTVSAVTAVVSAVFSGTGSEKYIKYVSAVIASVVILSPLCKLAGADIETVFPASSGSFEKEDGERLMYSFLNENGKEALEELIGNIILSNFGIKTRSVSIIIEYNENGCLIKSGEIDLGGKGDPDKVKKLLTENIGAAKWKVS